MILHSYASDISRYQRIVDYFMNRGCLTVKTTTMGSTPIREMKHFHALEYKKKSLVSHISFNTLRPKNAKS